MSPAGFAGSLFAGVQLSLVPENVQCPAGQFAPERFGGQLIS